MNNCKSYPKDKLAGLAAELAKFTDNLKHRESVRLLDTVFKPAKKIEPKENMELWEILVPAVMGEKSVKTKHHKSWDRYVRKLSGGLTVLHTAKGQWLRPESEELVEERMIPVRVACTEKDMKKIAQFTLKHYKQDSVMAYQISNKVLAVEKKK